MLHNSEDFALLHYTVRIALMEVQKEYNKIAHPDTIAVRVPAIDKQEVVSKRQKQKKGEPKVSATVCQLLHKSLPNAKGETEISQNIPSVLAAANAAKSACEALGVAIVGDLLILASDVNAVAKYSAPKVESPAPAPAPAPASEEPTTPKKGRKKKADNGDNENQ